jgi:hypothetical protein
MGNVSSLMSTQNVAIEKQQYYSSASLHHVTVNSPFMMIFGHQQQSYPLRFSYKVPSILIVF